MIRIAFALFLLAHAIAHVPEFLVSWHMIANRPDLPYRTAIFGGAVHVGRAGMRVVGLLWLVAGFGVAYAAIELMRNAPVAWPAAWAAAAFSGIMTIVGWPDSRTGAVLNAVTFAALIWFLL
ncbi:MAG: hypothetical protein ACRENU_13235 [Gemmatimonadaceae bacterium]